MRPHVAMARVWVGVCLTALYFVAAKIGLRLALQHPSASPVWPSTGIALAAMLLLGPRLAPAIFVGAFVANVTTAGNVATSLGIAAGNTLECVLGAHLVHRFAGGPDAFDRSATLFRFVLLAALLCTALSATIGVGSLWVGGFALRAELPRVWLTWWLGDAVGAILLTPLLVLWVDRPRAPARTRLRSLEAVLLLIGLSLASWL